MKAKLFSLKTKDAVKALILSVLTSTLIVVQTSLDAGELNFNWNKIGMVALASAVAYIVKNWLTNSDDKFLKKESK